MTRAAALVAFALLLMVAPPAGAQPPAMVPPPPPSDLDLGSAVAPALPPGGVWPTATVVTDGVKFKQDVAGGHGAGHEDEAHSPAAIIFSGEFFLMAPRRRSQDYAVVGTNPYWAPVGTIKSVDGSYDPGFRVGAGYRFEGGLEVVFSYTHFNTGGDDSVRAPNTPGSVLYATLTHPASVVQVATASASNSINLNLFDLVGAKRLDLGEGLAARLFAGPRFANLDQKFTAVYTGGDSTKDTVRRAVTFDGGGLRAGGELNYKFFDHLGLYLRGSASLMTGRFRSRLSEASNGFTVVNADEKFDKVIPIAEMGIGLSYQKGPMRLSVGYEFMNWFGMLEGFDFVDDSHPAKMTRRSGDIGFDGVVFRFEYLF